MPLQSFKTVNQLQTQNAQHEEQCWKSEVNAPPKLVSRVVVDHGPSDVGDHHAESLEELVEGAELADHRGRSDGVYVDGDDGSRYSNDKSKSKPCNYKNLKV